MRNKVFFGLSSLLKSFNLFYRYLTEAVVNLNFTDSAAKEHAPNILRELRQNCINFLKNNPSSPLVSGVKMLMMASQGVGN